MKASIDHLTFYTQNKTPIMLFEYILCIQVETGVIGLIFKARNSKTGISSIKQTKIHKVEIESIFSSVSPLDWMHIMIWFNIHKYICKIIIFLSKVPSNQVEQLSMWFWSYFEFFFFLLLLNEEFTQMERDLMILCICIGNENGLCAWIPKKRSQMRKRDKL